MCFKICICMYQYYIQSIEKASGLLRLPAPLTVLSFGVDGVVLVDPELVKGKRGEGGLPGLVQAGAGRRASMWREPGSRRHSASHTLASRPRHPQPHV